MPQRNLRVSIAEKFSGSRKAGARLRACNVTRRDRKAPWCHLGKRRIARASVRVANNSLTRGATETIPAMNDLLGCVESPCDMRSLSCSLRRRILLLRDYAEQEQEVSFVGMPPILQNIIHAEIIEKAHVSGMDEESRHGL